MTACFLQTSSSAWGGSRGGRGRGFPKKQEGRKRQGRCMQAPLLGAGEVTGQEKDDGQ